MYVWESVHKQEVSFAETYFILAVCEDLRKLSDLRTGTCVLKRDVIKFFPVLLIEIGQEFFKASSFSLILFCLCLFCFFFIMSRLILVFLPMILIASFVLGERFASCKFTLVYVSKLTYQVIRSNFSETNMCLVCNWEIIRYELFLAEIILLV